MTLLFGNNLPCHRLNSESSGSSWAAAVATYCPGRMSELPNPKSMGGFHQRDGSPCKSVLPDGHLMPESVAYPCGDLDDLGAVGHGVDQLEAALVQLQRDVLLPRVARVDAQDDTLKKEESIT